MRGYFTLEAVLIFPIVLTVYFFLIYMGFFQYDRCLMEQDLKRALIRGEGMNLTEEEELLAETEKMFSAMAGNKYIIVEPQKPKLKIERGVLSGREEVSMETPILGWNDSGLDTVWKIDISAERQLTDPVFLIRTWDRIGKELQNGKSGESESPIPENGSR